MAKAWTDLALPPVLSTRLAQRLPPARCCRHAPTLDNRTVGDGGATTPMNPNRRSCKIARGRRPSPWRRPRGVAMSTLAPRSSHQHGMPGEEGVAKQTMPVSALCADECHVAANPGATVAGSGSVPGQAQDPAPMGHRSTQCRDIARNCRAGGHQALAVHGRTRAAIQWRGRVRDHCCGKQAVNNSGVRQRRHRLAAKGDRSAWRATGADGIMIGARGKAGVEFQ